MATYGILINAVLMALNLLPLLPLDGGRVLHSLLPVRISALYAKTEPWGFFILIALLATGILSKLLLPAVGVLKLISAQIVGIVL
jgi:Zn-dependent protease